MAFGFIRVSWQTAAAKSIGVMEGRLLFGNNCKITARLLLVETKNRSMFHPISTDLPLNSSLCSSSLQWSSGEWSSVETAAHGPLLLRKRV